MNAVLAAALVASLELHAAEPPVVSPPPARPEEAFTPALKAIALASVGLGAGAGYFLLGRRRKRKEDVS